MAAELVESPPNPPTIRRKITNRDVEEMCKLMAKRITETGACLMLGIRPQSWFNWKAVQRNNSKFQDYFVRIREEKLNACLEAIDEAGDKRTYVNKKGEVCEASGDWRAKAWMAERAYAPDRFSDRQQAPVTNNLILGELETKRLLETIYGASKAVVDCPPSVKAIEVQSVGVDTPSVDTK